MAATATTMIEHVGHVAFVLLLIPFAYALFRAAALGWFRTKYEHQRRFMDGLNEENYRDGK